MNRPRFAAARFLACASASAVFFAGFGMTAAHAEPTPLPSPPAPPALPGGDDPTTIPTGGPSLPGEGGEPAPEYSEPPDNIGESKPPVKLDAQAAGLRLADDAELAPAKVLDIKFVTEEVGGGERREDSTVKTKFTLQAEVLFPKNSAKLNSGARDRISEIAEEVDEQGARRLNVFGFTDDLGSYAHGKKLSKARANAVQLALSEALDSGVGFNVRGYSEDYPVADNKTEEGREKNRRVEISFPRQD